MLRARVSGLESFRKLSTWNLNICRITGSFDPNNIFPSGPSTRSVV